MSSMFRSHTPDVMNTDRSHSYMPTSNPSSHSEQLVAEPPIQSPHFSFEDFLTPEYSSENPTSSSDLGAHTPTGIDELSWKHDYNDQSPHQTSTDTSFANSSAHLTYTHELNSFQGVQFSQTKYFSTGVNDSQLLSPRLTTTPSPSEPITIGQKSSGHKDVECMTPDSPKMSKRKLDPRLHLQTSSDIHHHGRSNHGSLEPSPIDQHNRAVSPVVMVSSYTRGDSPARSNFSLSRSASKRSHGSRSSDRLAPRLSNESDDDMEVPSDNLSLTATQPLDMSGMVSSQDRAGLSPAQRGDALVPSLEDIEANRKLREKNADVATWLAKSETGSQNGEDDSRMALGRRKSQKHKIRSRSTGAPTDALGIRAFDDTHIPGPGVLVDQESEDDESDEEVRSVSEMSARQSPSPAAKVDTEAHLDATEYFPPIEDIAPEEQEPLPRQFYRQTLWQDPIRSTGLSDTHDQPATSNAAIYRYDQQAAKFETASRAATWGTRRRLSEADITSIVEGSKIRHLSLSKGRERGRSFIGKLKNLPRRSPSISKAKSPEIPTVETSVENAHTRGASLSSIPYPQRMASVGKSKSPARTAGNAFAALTSHFTAAGRSSSAIPETAIPETAPPPSPFQKLKRSRSKSDLPKGAGRGKPAVGLVALMTQHGGPPMPTLASPMHERRVSAPKQESRMSDDEDEDEDEEEEEDGAAGIKGASMNFEVRADNIIPTLEGFKTHARQLNPRLEPFLIDRIANEQLRRYKKLVDNKIKHAQAVVIHEKCPSGPHCFDLNGEATLLPPRPNAKDPEATYAQFQITGHGDTDDDEVTIAEGVVAPALFPSGIPLPPVKRLPAKFECPLCFKVKTFQKPSDWTKHVHEDVQPFSCTFPTCTDPKSFKRKADWVRHENERHRHLEWWQCNIQECNHVCYRKDNFVQHLVREHKLPEPKVKRGSGSSKARILNGSHWPEVDEVSRLLDECHHDTPRKPRDETCKFCGNCCNTWKKVSSHLGKHMEQIALPVLELVRQREVSPDTIISPVEQHHPPPMPMAPLHTGMSYSENQGNISPYPMSATSMYQGSSAAHSPAAMQSYPQGSQMQYVAGYPNSVGPASQMQVHTTDMGNYASVGASPSSMVGGPFPNMPPASSFVAVNASTYPSGYSMVRRSPLQGQLAAPVPRSQPLQHEMHMMQLHTASDAGFNHQGQHQAIYSSPVEAVPYIMQYNQPMVPHQHMSAGTNQRGYESMTTTAMPNESIYDARRMGEYSTNGQQHMGPGFPY